jgi:hypothetical protein
VVLAACAPETPDAPAMVDPAADPVVDSSQQLALFGTGWPNVMVFEEDQFDTDAAMSATAAQGKREKWTVRIHMDLQAPGTSSGDAKRAFDDLATLFKANPRDSAAIANELKTWNTRSGPPEDLIGAMSFKKGGTPSNGRLEYDLFADYGTQDGVTYWFRFRMDVVTKNSGEWAAVTSALALASPVDRTRELKAALKAILKAPQPDDDSRYRIIDAIVVY